MGCPKAQKAAVTGKEEGTDSETQREDEEGSEEGGIAAMTTVLTLLLNQQMLCPLDYHAPSCTYILSLCVPPDRSYQTMTSFIGLICYLDT